MLEFGVCPDCQTAYNTEFPRYGCACGRFSAWAPAADAAGRDEDGTGELSLRDLQPVRDWQAVAALRSRRPRRRWAQRWAMSEAGVPVGAE